MKPPELCVTCRYYRAAEDDPAVGVCHHAPPVPSLADPDEDEDSTVSWGIWPLVTATDFCSEWRPVKFTFGTRMRLAADQFRRAPRPAPRVRL